MASCTVLRAAWASPCLNWEEDSSMSACATCKQSFAQSPPCAASARLRSSERGSRAAEESENSNTASRKNVVRERFLGGGENLPIKRLNLFVCAEAFIAGRAGFSLGTFGQDHP